MRDVIIIGAGVTGSAIARELSRYERDVLVLEKNSDVAEGTSKANSGIVHAGYDAKPGSLMAKLNLQGNLMMEQLSKDLDFPFKKNGSLVLCFSEEDRPKLEELYQRGVTNGVPDIQILSKEEVLKMEPNLSEEIVGALYAPTGGIVCPFNLTIALAENANVNGVEFQLETSVTGIERIENGYRVHTDKGDFDTAMVVNAAGVYADAIHNMVSEEKIHITPRKGEYCLMDKKVGDFVSNTIFQLPGKYGKGVLVTPTVHGNLLVGPTATDQEDKEEDQTTQAGLDDVLAKAGKSVKTLPRQIITSFAGLRAHGETGDFIIGEVKDAPGFIDAAGIESPGLTSAPAIGIMVADLIQKLAPAKEKTDFIATRKGIPSMALASNEERAALIK
nr:NAD(P)/FAD-dependent oxidoreductase [Lachnospiraceae bacterium]